MHCFLKHSTLLFLSLFLQSQQVTPTQTSQVSTTKPAQYEVKSFIVFSRSLIYSIYSHYLIYLSDGKTPIPQKGLYCTLQLYRPIASPLDVDGRLLFPSCKYSGVYSVRDATVFLRGVVS